MITTNYSRRDRLAGQLVERLPGFPDVNQHAHTAEMLDDSRDNFDVSIWQLAAGHSSDSVQ